MERGTQNRLMLLGLVVVVCFSAYLRLVGINWGMNGVAGIRLASNEGERGYGHYLAFHPDEFISLRGASPIKLLRGELKAPDAYFEGTLNYYFWAMPRIFADFRSSKQAAIHPKSPDQLTFVLLAGRLMSVAFDLTTLVLLYAIIRDLTHQRLPALFGALLYGVIPMQVIYSHFMRTYTLANLLCVLVIWLSLKTLKLRHWGLFVITGMAAGLAAATRYPAALILSVPCGFILLQESTPGEKWRQRFTNSLLYLLSGPLWLLGAGFILGLVAGEPMLVFDFKSVVDAISFEASQYAPPGGRHPFDLAPIWKYLSVLIPHATYPVLWVLIYVSTLYVVLRPSLWPTVVPLCVFMTLYTYAMAKGYLDAFSRLTMLLMPVFCILAGLACGVIFPKIVKRPLVLGLVAITMLLLISPSVIFDLAYGQTMKGRDVRDQLRNDMQTLVSGRSSTTINVSKQGGYGGYFYTAMPAVFPLKSKSNNVEVQIVSSLVTPADFLVIGFEAPITEKSRNSMIRRVEIDGMFDFVKAYSRAPTIFGKTLNLSKFPSDMTYPFPTILLFRRVPHPEEAASTPATFNWNFRNRRLVLSAAGF